MIFNRNFIIVFVELYSNTINYLDKMASSAMIAATHWNVPYLFKGARIIDDSNHSWIGGQRLADLLNQKLLSFRIGKRQKALFGSLFIKIFYKP